jgi:hypothetical protein
MHNDRGKGSTEAGSNKDERRNKKKQRHRSKDRAFNCFHNVSVEREWREFVLQEFGRYQSKRAEELIEQHRKAFEVTTSDKNQSKNTNDGVEKKKKSKKKNDVNGSSDAPAKWDREQHGKKWCSLEGTLKLAEKEETLYFERSSSDDGDDEMNDNGTKSKAKKNRANLFSTPKIKKEVKTATNHAIAEIGQQNMLALNKSCRMNDRKIVNSSDWYSCLLGVHGFKRGKELMKMVTEDLEKQAREKEKEWESVSV